MTLDPRFREVLARRAAARLPELWQGSVQQARDQVAQATASLPAGPYVAAVRDVVIRFDGEPAVTVRMYEPGPAPLATIVFFHGGGWVLGDLSGADPVCRALAVASGCSVASVAYRLAPEHPFPAAVDDAFAAVRHVAQHMAPGVPVVVCGDSAGGNLATVVARRARDLAGPAIAYQALVYPVVDHDLDRPSYHEHSAGLLLTRRDMAWFWDRYLPDVRLRSHPDASPLRAPTLAGMPPTLILVAGYDPLRDECLAYAQALRKAGVPVTVRTHDTVGHGFFRMLGIIPQSELAVREIATEVRRALGAPVAG